MNLGKSVSTIAVTIGVVWSLLSRSSRFTNPSAILAQRTAREDLPLTSAIAELGTCYAGQDLN